MLPTIPVFFFFLNTFVCLNKAALYNKVFIHKGINDFSHLMNLAGEIMNYDYVSKKFTFLPIIFSY